MTNERWSPDPPVGGLPADTGEFLRRNSGAQEITDSSRESRPSPPSPEPSAAGALEANLILIAHPHHQGLGNRFRLSPGSHLEIGRAPECQVSLPEIPSISRSHARVEYRDDGVVLLDLESTNGTYVNDRRAEGPTLLRSGDRFQVGPVHFKFLHETDVEHAYHIAIFDLVTRDGLTGIYNKRKFEEEFEREFSRARRYSRPLALISIDIDHFKRINDGFGHLAGDFVLKQVVSRIQSTLRAEQVFARVGGEEFAILCPETDAARASLLGEKLRRRIEEESCPFEEDEIDVTCSFGISELGPGIQTIYDLTRAADDALYMSKERGRNRVSISSSASNPS
jgi:two-component system cell cycle response regulator